MRIQDEIYKTIDILIRERLKSFPYNYCLEGTIKIINSDGTYDVEILDSISKIKPLDNTKTYNINDIVFVLVINNDFSNKYILCKKP